MRMNIYVPDELRKRMDKGVAKAVNWSALACRAFEDKLAELAAQKKEKTMKDVITRLRASKRKNEDEETKLGREAGMQWAKESAEAAELERAYSIELDEWSEHSTDGAHSLAELFAFKIQPELDRNRGAAADFWQSQLDAREMPSPTFVIGFIEGAGEVWEAVSNEL